MDGNEKSFYAEQNGDDARQVLTNLDRAIEVTQLMHATSDLSQQKEENLEKLSINYINEHLQQYRTLFQQGLDLWQRRGFSREDGLGLKLRTAAYEGLRNRLALYDTEELRDLMSRIRWQEYEFYLHHNMIHVSRIREMISDFRQEIISAKLENSLSKQFTSAIADYEFSLDQLITQSDSSSLRQTLEIQAKKLNEIIEAHTISNYSFLLRTLLYYEMEYRELGQQEKHVQGVLHTLGQLTEQINNSGIDKSEKVAMVTVIGIYNNAFKELTRLDDEIKKIKEATTREFQQVTPAILKAVAKEEQVMQEIRSSTAADNNRNNQINLGVMIVTIFLAIAIVTWMVRRLGGKVSRIGSDLTKIAAGNLEITTPTTPEKNRDELDWISFHIAELADSLSVTMRQLQDRNKELELISNKLAKYLSPQVYTSIFSGKQAVKIQSQRKKLTVFFSDIVGFTSTTDNMESEELTTVLNDYLNEMSQIALKYGGTIDKFIGDAIMIFFGDPESRGEKEDALSCVSMALTMRQRIHELRRRWEEDLGVSRPFRIRIGITTGYCTVGNFGSEERMDYTIIGGHVNLANRLEEHAKPNEILISSETQALIKDKIQCHKQDTIKVKGISQPVRTYQVIGHYDHREIHQISFHESGEGYNITLEGNHLVDSERLRLADTLESMVKKLKEI